MIWRNASIVVDLEKFARGGQPDNGSGKKQGIAVRKRIAESAAYRVEEVLAVEECTRHGEGLTRGKTSTKK